MELVGQTVPHGNAGVAGEILDHGLLEAAVLDTVEHASEDLCGVGEGFLLAHLGGAGIEEGDAHAEVACADFKCAAGTGGGLLEEKDDLLVGEPLVLDAVVLHALELGSEVKKVVDLLGSVVEKSEEASAANVKAHNNSPPKGNDSNLIYITVASEIIILRG